MCSSAPSYLLVIKFQVFYVILLVIIWPREGLSFANSLKDQTFKSHVELWSNLRLSFCAVITWERRELTILSTNNGWLQDQLSEFHTLHVLLGDLIEAIVQGIPLQASLFTQPCRDNSLYLLSLVDELVMGEAFRLLPVSSYTTHIKSLQLVCLHHNMDLCSF